MQPPVVLELRLPGDIHRTASWLSVTPGSGQLKGTTSSVVTASVNAAGLAPSKNPYYADLSFVFGQSSLTVMAQLTVQAAPPTAPIMSASPLSLNFSNIQGQPDPTGQVVTITNNGHSPLSWHVTATPLLPSFVWLSASPSGGTIAPGQSGQVTVKVNTAQLTPGNYVGQITLNGMDAKGNPAPGSPQTIDCQSGDAASLYPVTALFERPLLQCGAGRICQPGRTDRPVHRNRQLCVAALMENLGCTRGKLVDANMHPVAPSEAPGNRAVLGSRRTSLVL